MKHDASTPGTTLQSPPPRSAGLHAFTRGLGCISLALGIVELVWPRQVMRLADIGERPGPDRSETLVRAQGVRELAVGTGLLTATEPEPWAWARVAGDVVDLAAVVLAPRRRGLAGGAGGSRSGALLAIVAMTAVDVLCAQALHHERQARQARQRDWSRRSGFAQTAESMRGAASDFTVPPDQRTPELLRPWARDQGSPS